MMIPIALLWLVVVPTYSPTKPPRADGETQSKGISIEQYTQGKFVIALILGSICVIGGITVLSNRIYNRDFNRFKKNLKTRGFNDLPQAYWNNREEYFRDLSGFDFSRLKTLLHKPQFWLLSGIRTIYILRMTFRGNDLICVAMKRSAKLEGKISLYFGPTWADSPSYGLENMVMNDGKLRLAATNIQQFVEMPNCLLKLDELTKTCTFFAIEITDALMRVYVSADFARFEKVYNLLEDLFLGLEGFTFTPRRV